MERTLRDEINVLQDKGGHLYVDKVWKTAQANPSSALYGRFNWNLEEAAIEHWRTTARQLIREFRLVVETTNTEREIEVRQFVRDPATRQGYRNTTKLKNSPEMAAASLAEMVSKTRGQLVNTMNLAEYWGFEPDALKNSLDEMDRFAGLLRDGLLKPTRGKRKGKAGESRPQA
jgi:hypothetical protein